MLLLNEEGIGFNTLTLGLDAVNKIAAADIRARNDTVASRANCLDIRVLKDRENCGESLVLGNRINKREICFLKII